MPQKSTILSYTSIVALAMALAQPGVAEEAAGAAPAESGPSAAAEAPPAPPMVAAPTPSEPSELPAAIAERRAEHEKLMSMTPEERWESRRAELNERYADLRSRAAEAGMQLPETPPWDRTPRWMSYEQMRGKMQEQGVEMPAQPAWGPGMGPGRTLMTDEERQANRAAMMNMTPEEREAFREQHYQQMRERAQAHGMELPETPPWKQAPQMPTPPPMPETPDWAKIKEVISSMTPEQLEACMSMHRMPMGGPMQPPPMAPPEPGYGPGRPYGYGPGMGYGQGPGGYGQGPGYGPRWQQAPAYSQ